MSKRRASRIIQRLERRGCTHLAERLHKDRGIGRQFEPAGSLNGFRIHNPHRRALSALITGGLEGAGVEQARRTVDIVFRSTGAAIRQSERDILAHMLVKGELRRK
jgi:hypothetical protein